MLKGIFNGNCFLSKFFMWNECKTKLLCTFEYMYHSLFFLKDINFTPHSCLVLKFSEETMHDHSHYLNLTTPMTMAQVRRRDKRPAFSGWGLSRGDAMQQVGSDCGGAGVPIVWWCREWHTVLHCRGATCAQWSASSHPPSAPYQSYDVLGCQRQPASLDSTTRLGPIEPNPDHALDGDLDAYSLTCYGTGSTSSHPPSYSVQSYIQCARSSAATCIFGLHKEARAHRAQSRSRIGWRFGRQVWRKK